MTTTQPKKAPKGAAPTRAVTLVDGRPTLTVTFERGTSPRLMRAALFIMASEVELASEGQSWIVHVDHAAGWPYTSMSIQLELCRGSQAEASLGLSLLNAAARQS